MKTKYSHYRFVAASAIARENVNNKVITQKSVETYRGDLKLKKK